MRKLHAGTVLDGEAEVEVRLRGKVVLAYVDGEPVYALIAAPVDRERCLVEHEGKTCEAVVLRDIEALGLGEER